MPSRRTRLRIVNVPSEEEWAEKARLPRALVRYERSTTPCATCPAHCCHGVVHTTLVEAARVALSLQMPMDAFVRAVPVEAPRPFEPSTALLLDGGPARLAFRSEERHRCVFLHDVGDRRRCSIHALRPGICRQYPFKLDDGGARVDVGTEELCPTGWLWNDAILAEQRASLRAWRRDLALDAELAARWNDGAREDRSLPALCRFAVVEAAPLLGLDPSPLYPKPRRRLGERG